MKRFKISSLILTTAVLSIFSSVIFAKPSLTQTEQSSTGISTTTISGTLRDFKANHPDFERTPGDISGDGSVFAYGLDTQITTDTLGDDGKPVYAGGSFSSTTENNFNQWFNDVENVNKSMDYTITLTDADGDGTYTYARDVDEFQSFFPLDGKLFGNEGNEHNYHFTYELETEFTYVPGTESEPRIFTFKGDDDVYVYIDGQKVIDIGGVHLQREQSVNLDELGLLDGETYTLKLFFAERHRFHSNFRLDTNIKLPEIIVFAD